MSDERRLHYLSDIVLSKIYIKDAKLFNLFPFISEKFTNTWNTLFSAKRKLTFKYTVLVSISTFLPEISMISFMVVIGIGVISKQHTVGDYSYYIGIAGQVLACMYLIVRLPKSQ